MAEVKGVLLEAWRLFVNDQFGEEALSKAREKLTTEDKRLLSNRFLPSSWYPYETFTAYRHLVREMGSDVKADFGTELGKFMAKYAYNGVYGSLLARDPLRQAEKYTWMDDFLVRGMRKIETRVTGPTSCTAVYRYQEGLAPSKGMCSTLLGFWQQMLEMAGAQGVSGMHSKCVLDGSGSCEFIFNWLPVN